MTKVLLIGHSPPPYGGQAIMIEQLLASDVAGVEFLHVNMHLSHGMNEFARFRWRKFFALLGIIARIIYIRFRHGTRVLYYFPAGPARITVFRDLAILLSTRWLFRKTIFHFQSGGLSEFYETLPRWQQWLCRRAYFDVDAAARLSVLTPPDAKFVRAQREYIIPNAVKDPQPELAIPQDLPTISAARPLRILFVGILVESKGLLVLVEACAELAKRGISFNLEIMGAPDSQQFVDRVRQRIAELNLSEQVRFLGVLTGRDKYAVYARSDVLSLPSFYENEAFPVVLVEAMALGLPIVSTWWRGIPSIVDDDETGYLVEPHDSAAVADRLARLAQDARLRRRMSVAARDKFLREFTLEQHVELVRRMILDVADDRRPIELPADNPAEAAATSLEPLVLSSSDPASVGADASRPSAY